MGREQKGKAVEKCVHPTSNGGQCAYNQTEQYRPYCTIHGKLKEKQAKAEEEDREATERGLWECDSSNKIASKLDAITALFEDLTMKMNDVRKVTEVEGETLRGRDMETLQNAMNGLFSAEEHFKRDLKTVSSAVTDVHRRCEKAKEFRRVKTKLFKRNAKSLYSR